VIWADLSDVSCLDGRRDHHPDRPGGGECLSSVVQPDLVPDLPDIGLLDLALP
jgi:hypothetical protein